MREMLESGDDREAVLTRFIGSLSLREEELLAELLDDTRARESD
jgi:hypothetical protein